MMLDLLCDRVTLRTGRYGILVTFTGVNHRERIAVFIVLRVLFST